MIARMKTSGADSAFGGMNSVHRSSGERDRLGSASAGLEKETELVSDFLHASVAQRDNQSLQDLKASPRRAQRETDEPCKTNPSLDDGSGKPDRSRKPPARARSHCA